MQKNLRENIPEQRIDILSSISIKKWCAYFNCTEQDLIFAVLNKGSEIKHVKEYIDLNRKLF